MADVRAFVQKPFVKGFTTNPTLMKKAGVADYTSAAKDILTQIGKKPISFEVFADEPEEMERQARIIHTWGPNVYVKIPVTNTKKQSLAPLIKKLSAEGIPLNVTAVFTIPQVRAVLAVLSSKTPSVVSVFAGRIADTGVDPMPTMKAAKALTRRHKKAELLWAASRQLLDVYRAEAVGADIITVSPDIVNKFDKIGYDQTRNSLDAVKAFYEDGRKAGFAL